MPEAPWLLVFDLDGTLIDSSLDLCLAVNAAMRHVGYPERPHGEIASYIGDGAAALVRRSLRGSRDEAASSQSDGRLHGTEVSDEALDYFLRFYREHKLDNTHLYPGVPEALQRIRAAAPALPMAVLTNKPVGPSAQICEALGIARFFFAIRGGDSFPTKKPDPEGLQRLLAEGRDRADAREAGSLPADGAVLVGDSEVDVETARRAGVRVLGCRYGLAPQRLEAAQPEMLCDAPSEWPTLLGFCLPDA